MRCMCRLEPVLQRGRLARDGAFPGGRLRRAAVPEAAPGRRRRAALRGRRHRPGARTSFRHSHSLSCAALHAFRLGGAWPLCLWKIACMRIGVSLGPRFRHMRIPSKRVWGMAVWWSGRLAYLTCNVHSTVSDRGEKLRRTLVSLWGHHQQSSLSLCARGVTP